LPSKRTWMSSAARWSASLSAKRWP
jgi:hypothetical protein